MAKILSVYKEVVDVEEKINLENRLTSPCDFFIVNWFRSIPTFCIAFSATVAFW